MDPWLHTAIMLMVNAYLVWVLVRVMRAVKRMKQSDLFADAPFKAECSRHTWDRTEVEEASGVDKVLYCTECGMVSGTDTRYFKREAVEKMAAQRKLIADFKEAKFNLIRSFVQEMRSFLREDRSTVENEAENMTRELLDKVNQLEYDFVVRKNALMRMDGTEQRKSQ
jgi:hypothetical protein